MKLEEILKKPITILETEPVIKAAKIMDEKKIGSLIVVNKEKKLTGIITEKDIIKRFLAKDKPKSTTVKEVMSTDIITVTKDIDLDTAAEIMSKNKIRRLPIVDNGKLIGIVTARDLLENSTYFDENWLF